jgi:diguanylate cyclase (GGDEF)-like protein/PAS domain S-box-containing protein
MTDRNDRYLTYLSLVLFLAYALTIFNLTLSFGNWIFDFFSLYKSLPISEFLININFLILLGLLWILYRRWRHEAAGRREKEESLLALQKAVENMQIGVTISDPKGRILYINPAEAEMHGYKVEDLTGKDARILGPPEIWKPMSRPALKRFKRETMNVRKDGSTFPVQLMSDIVTGPDGDVFAVITTCEDITERRKNEETIRQLAFYDPLCGLPNRALFNDRLIQELAKARRHKSLLAIMFVDIDRFKIVNDTLGHRVGDLLLKAVSGRLKTAIRESDTVSRLGGDEFIILFPDISHARDISAIAKKVLVKLSQVFVINEMEVYITASIGISFFPESGDDMEALIRNADAAMYYAKEQGRNNYQFYTSEISQNAVEKLKLQGNLRKALKQNEFLMHYQPQVDLRSGRIVGAEALVRWQHPDYGLVGPKKFIPLAEESGLISSIGEFLLFTACAQTKAWQEAGFSQIRMAVNISTYQLVQKGFLKFLTTLLKEIDLEPKYLELEFTESVVLQHSDLVAETLRELASLGIQCAVDDFGTGYSALSYLKYLPLQRLKLDQSFVGALTIDPNDEAISKAIIAMAHDLNLKVTAEGVETVQQLEFLRAHDCDEAQGFLFSEPLPAKDFVQLLIGEGTTGKGVYSSGLLPLNSVKFGNDPQKK